MAQLETNVPRKDVNVRTAQMIQLISEIGPDIPEISRRLGQFKESVRYRYKEKIVNKGMSVQAAVDHEKLGLRRLVLVADFADEFRPYASTILMAMSKLCYVVGFVKTLPHGEYLIHASVAEEHLSEVAQLFEDLKTKGLFTSMEIMDFDWFRNAPMRAEFYDFDEGSWDFDWSAASMRDYSAANFVRSSKEKFDEVDLLLVKELQIDANKSLKEISENLKINYKKLAWHYSTHVLARKLIRGYKINWMGTTYDTKNERAAQRQHKYFAVNLFVKSVSENERMTLRQKINQLPYLWGEAAGNNYFADLAFPVESVTEGFQYLEEAIAPVRDRATIQTADQTNAITFSVPYELYDSNMKAWSFNRREVLTRFDELILKVRELA